MPGRKPIATTPRPYCNEGHRRTQRTTRWVELHIGGRDYLQIRCLICKAKENRLRYYRRATQARITGEETHGRPERAADH